MKYHKTFYFSTKSSCGIIALMTQYSKPFAFRVTGGSLAITIPINIVNEMGLVPGDAALFRREPDGLKLRIIKHSTMVELANAQEAPTALKNAVEQEAPVDAA